jgi:endoglucanase
MMAASYLPITVRQRKSELCFQKKRRKNDEKADLPSVVGAMLAVAVAAAPAMASAKSPAVLDPKTQFYVPKVNKGATEQIANLTSRGNKADANLIKQLVQTPQAVWFTKGTPKTVLQDVRNTVSRAADKGQVPVLVAYNIPFRDCAQYSAGSATSVAEYEAWIDGFAAGIGSKKAVVVLEPDGLGIIPWYKQFSGLPSQSGSYEWCQPAEANQATAAIDRFAMMNYAVDKLKANPNTSVYLDATHSGWLGSGDAAHRLLQAGVLRADGFFLNVSNYQLTDHLVKYGDWVSKCIAFANNPEEGGWRLNHYDWCASQYYPANPGDFSTWHLTDEWYASNLGHAVPTAHYVIDTSRNGQGPWVAPADHPAGDPQDWCNPPDRGLGLQPTTNTSYPLIDAYLWIKLPGESDGQCYRWTSGPEDPVRGIEDPAAGGWFPDMALELVHNANPPMP